MPSNELKAIREAITGLLYSSETDAPFEPVSWDAQLAALMPDDLRSLVELELDVLIEEESLDDFFGDLIEEQDWHDEEDKQTVQRYRNLLKVLKTQLADIHVYRVGQTEIDVYVVGRTAEGKWAGIKTMSVET